MSTSREPIMFLSGAGLPAWIWDDVRRDLGEGQQTWVASRPQGGRARLRDYAQAVIDSAPPGGYAIVAHSAGGVIGAEVARLVPERVSAFLAISAVIPQPGGSFISAMPVPNRWVLSAAMRFAGTRPPASAIRRGLAHGLDEEVADRIIADFTPESPALYRDRTAHRSWSGWRGYLRTTGDHELPMALQQRCAQRLGAAWQNDLNTGHLPMLEDHQAVAAAIRRFLDARP
ncbi:alpha/beta hydrolase [Micromonospora soli]|uniref:alpha/beta fold hydrolase n=1 Tax=Micromonospora sp. NBRC 110009 TaxID=3061627 RepID=UPI002671F514|nr:alpha/beta hydrolase [Micromonospora sp. NBRC 110009]WKT96990.1 alpha/beta hydrolase [Micromonospora sp. NBRC 110009]